MGRHSRSQIVEKTIVNDVDNAKQDDYQLSEDKFQKKRHSNFFIEFLRDCILNSNLHGLKYLGKKNRTIVERIFWLFMVTCCVVLCACLIKKTYNKWNENPVIVSFAEHSSPVWQIPYPAITICSETKAMQTRYNFTENYHRYFNSSTYVNLTEKERNMFEDISMVCEDQNAPSDGRKFSSGTKTVNNLISVSPNITDFFFGCKWNDAPKESCSDLFSPILTEEGLCYTFNSIGANDLFRVENLHNHYSYLENITTNITWTLDKGYAPGTPIDTYPHRGMGYGVKAGLTILLKTKEIDLNYLCKGPVQSFKILLHNPAELPRLSQKYFRAPLSQEIVVAVKPKMMVTSDGLISYKPNIRQCYFQNERYLRYFKVYTQANCEIECLVNYTNARCGCVHFGVPHEPNIKECNAGSMQCIRQAQMELVTIEIQSEFQDDLDKTWSEASKIAKMCSCMPACSSIDYEAESSQAEYDWKATFRAFQQEITEDTEDQLFTRVLIFFKEPQFTIYRRSELYGPTDFLANCGGLLGLFMGFSILSLVEILYFFTLRVYCVIWRRPMTKKQGMKDAQDNENLNETEFAL